MTHQVSRRYMCESSKSGKHVKSRTRLQLGWKLTVKLSVRLDQQPRQSTYVGCIDSPRRCQPLIWMLPTSNSQQPQHPLHARNFCRYDTPQQPSYIHHSLKASANMADRFPSLDEFDNGMPAVASNRLS